MVFSTVKFVFCDDPQHVHHAPRHGSGSWKGRRALIGPTKSDTKRGSERRSRSSDASRHLRADAKRNASYFRAIGSAQISERIVMVTRRIIQLSDGAVDPHKSLITFTLQTKNADLPTFVVEPHVAEQIAAGLTVLVRGLQNAQRAAGIPFTARPVHAETVTRYGVKADPFAEAVLLQIGTEKDIDYSFAIPKAPAADIGSRLQTESAKAMKPGRA
jgi:hypothetical protein